MLDVPAAQPEAGDTNCAEADEPKPLAQPCPCCGGRMIIIETFRRGFSPRYRPAASTAVIRIDKIREAVADASSAAPRNLQRRVPLAAAVGCAALRYSTAWAAADRPRAQS
jgi:hypothetical protein